MSCRRFISSGRSVGRSMLSGIVLALSKAEEDARCDSQKNHSTPHSASRNRSSVRLSSWCRSLGGSRCCWKGSRSCSCREGGFPVKINRKIPIVPISVRGSLCCPSAFPEKSLANVLSIHQNCIIAYPPPTTAITSEGTLYFVRLGLNSDHLAPSELSFPRFKLCWPYTAAASH